jgi:hypothetical protein
MPSTTPSCASHEANTAFDERHVVRPKVAGSSVVACTRSMALE